MKDFRLLTALTLVTLSVCASAQGRIVIGKKGEAISSTAIYSSPSHHARRLCRVSPYTEIVVKHSDNSDWDLVLLSNMRYGYMPAEAIVVLPFTVYSHQRSRSTPLMSRGGTSYNFRTGSEMANLAQNYVGTPYEWGGTDMSTGVDCSGFVKNIAGAIGLELPRTAAEQVAVGTPITRYEDLLPGDRLYFWDKGRGKIGHTAIYLGYGYFIHASHGKGAVTTTFLSAGWKKTLVAARR